MRNKHLFIISFLLTMSLNSLAQNIEKLIDSVYIKNILSEFYDFANSVDSLHEKKENFLVCIIYGTHLLDDDIEETKISPKYFLNGDFLKELEELQILKKNGCMDRCGYYFIPEHIIAFDTISDRIYKYKSSSNNRLESYFYLDEPFFHFLAKLYKNKQIDCMFFYPTIIRQPSIIHEHYSQLMYLAFAVKNGEFFVIRDGKGEIRAPALYSLEDYINCCWNEMIGIDD